MVSVRSFAALALACTSLSVHAAEGTPQFTQNGELLRPADYRQWVFVTSGLGMTYGPARLEPGQPPRFNNVFVRGVGEGQRSIPGKVMGVLRVQRRARSSGPAPAERDLL